MGSWGVPGADAADRSDALLVLARDLARFAERSGSVRLTPIISGLRRPIRIAVRGRRGVGVRTVCAALSARGVVAAPGADADVEVLVVAETLKPEERAFSVGDPTALIVLNKADLAAPRPGGPMASAQRQAAAIEVEVGVRTVAMAGLLAAVCDSLDEEAIGALRTLVGTPADLSSVDAFVACEHPVAPDVRARLLEGLDRFGIAHAVLALDRGADPASLSAQWRTLSNVDAAVEAIQSCVAASRYLRLQGVLRELRLLATQSGDETLDRWLSGDAPVMSAMTAAVDVVGGAGLRVDTGDRPDEHLGRAVHWRRYGRGPVGALHRDCSADIVRGSLRLFGDAVPR